MDIFEQLGVGVCGRFAHGSAMMLATLFVSCRDHILVDGSFLLPNSWSVVVAQRYSTSFVILRSWVWIMLGSFSLPIFSVTCPTTGPTWSPTFLILVNVDAFQCSIGQRAMCSDLALENNCHNSTFPFNDAVLEAILHKK